CLTPERHGAARIRRGGGDEGLRRLLVPEGMQVGDALLDLGTSGTAAGCGEPHVAQLLRVTVVLHRCLRGKRDGNDERRERRYGACHGITSLLSCAAECKAAHSDTSLTPSGVHPTVTRA